MKKNRIISFIIALTMLLSSLSGLTAITASADGESAPVLSDLVLMEKYSANFSEWTADGDALSAYDSDNWTQSGRVGKNGNNVDVKSTNGVLTFNGAAESGAFYYKYSVRMTNTGSSNTVSLCFEGADDDVAVLTSPLDAVGSYYTFTTVIDGDKAYTYDSAGTVVKTVSFEGTVIGLKFASASNNLLISSFSYGKIADVPELSSYKFLDKYSANFSTWTATDDSNGAKLTNYDETNWEQSGRVGINSSKLVQAKSANGDLAAGALTFKNTATSDKFYYEYEVRLATAACELSLKVDGGDDAVVLSTPYNSDKKNVYKYTTVVDGNIAYTYDKDNKAINAVEFTGTASGLKFASAGGEVLIKSFSYGKVIDPPKLDDFVLDEQDKPTFADWTADAGDNELTSYDTANWTASGRLGVAKVNGANQAQIKAASGDLTDGVLTYNKAADSGLFYYNYEVRMTDKSSNRNSVSLAGVDGAVVLTSPLANDSGTYKYTTVVDGDMAYTYNADNEFVKAVEFTGTVTGLTFKSTSGEIRIKEISFGLLKKDANIGIDYENEKLTGFVDGGSYTIGGESVTPVNNELDIAEEYFGHTLEIGGTLNEVELTQSLAIAARPDEPAENTDYTVTQPTAYGVDGSIAAAEEVTNLEYKIGDGEWTPLTTTPVNTAQGSTVLIRKVATDSTFASMAASVTIDTIAQTYTVKWKNGNVTLETDENVANGAAPSYNGETPEKTADAQYTYIFDGWTIGDGNGTVYNTTASDGITAFDAVTADITYVAHFTTTTNKYTVTWKVEGQQDNVQSLDYGAAIQPPQEPKKAADDGHTYTFEGWYLSTAEGAKVTDFGTVSGNVTYVAVFTSVNKTFNVTYHSDHGTQPEAATYTYGTGIAELPQLTDTNYNFDGWYDGADLTTASQVTSISASDFGDKDLYAKWTPISYSVTKASTTNGTVNLSAATATVEDTVTVTIVPDTGYQLATLTVGGEAVTGDALTNAINSNSYTFNMPAKAVEVSATFERKTVNKVEVTLDNSTATHGTAATITASAKVYASDNTDITSLYAADIVWSLDETTITANKTAISGNGTSATVSVGAEQAVGTVIVTATVGGKSDNKAITVSSEPTYTITVDNTITGGIVTTTPSGSTTKGQTVTITTTPNNGYQLKAGSVMVNDGAVTVTDNTFTMPEENVTITAEFEQINYTITDNTNDAHGSLTISKKEGLHYGDSQAVTIVPAQGYELDTLTVDGVNVTASVNNNNYTIENITGNVTITATFKEIPVSTYTVTITGGEGIENVKLGEKTGTKNGNTYTFTEVEAGEYNFDVTYTEGYDKAAASPTSITVSESKTSETISAQKKTYTITWNDDTNTLIDTTTVEHGTVPTHSEPTKDATAQYTYTFAGWTPTIAAATANTTYTATFTPVVKKYTATFNLNGGNINGSTANVEVQADYNTAPTPPENPIKDGYTFNGWSPAVSAITENTTFTAQWTENAPETVTVTFSAGQDGTLLGNSSKTITKGGTLAAGDIPAASKTGHTFDKWSDGTHTYTSAELAELSINSDTTFTATYTVNQYTITWNIEGAEAEEQYDYNTMPTYKNGTPQKAETAQYTYEFTTWSPDLSVVTAAQIYTAQFSETKKKYNITKATVSNGNSFTVSAESIEWGETITITPSAAEGYELKALSVTGTTTAYSIGEGITKVGDTYTFTMPAENVTVTPTFEATAPIVQQYTVTYTGTATGGTYSVIDVTSGSNVDENAVITIVPSADTANGYAIDAVYAYHTGDARTEIDKITDNGGYKYTVTADTTVEVTFKKIKYTITWKNWNGETLTTTEVEHGTVPSYPNDADAPAKDSDSEYDYTFDKWTPNLTEVTAAAEYTATYTQVAKEAPKTFLNLLEGFSSWLKIEKTNAADSDNVVLTVSKDQELQNDIPTLTAYIAVYNNGVLQSVEKHDFVSNAVTLPTAEATGDYSRY